MMNLSDTLLDRFLAEDVPYGDLTTHALGIGGRLGRMRFSARTAQVVCCIEEAVRLIERCGASAHAFVGTGDWCEPGTPLMEAEGPADSLLMAWKVSQTLMEATAGIATATRRIVEAALRGGGATVSCTRKNFPGTKEASIKAILAGGGIPHRLGLSESLLLFPEHRAFAPANDTNIAVARLRACCPEKKGGGRSQFAAGRRSLGQGWCGCLTARQVFSRQRS